MGPAPYTDFKQLLDSKKGSDKYVWADLDQEEALSKGSANALRFGNHVYVLGEEINITNLLSDLSSPAVSGPIYHLHLYCHRLTDTLKAENELELRLHEGSCALQSLHIFAAELPPKLSRLVLLATGKQPSVLVRLYCERSLGPESFWLNRSDAAPIHVLRNQTACLNRDRPPCNGLAHFDLSQYDPAGILLHVAGSTGVVSLVEAIPDVPWDELRPLHASELDLFGANAFRLWHLPRLLDSLFAAAAAELATSEPSLSQVMARLRFIRRLARAAPNYASYVEEVSRLYSQIELPKCFPSPEDVQTHDWFFVPDQNPKTLAAAISERINNMATVHTQIENKDDMANLEKHISDTDERTVAALKLVIQSTDDPDALKSAATKAANLAKSVSEKIGTLHSYQAELEHAREVFQKGLDAYKQEIEKEANLAYVKSVLEVGVTVGLAVYSGGASAALTVGDVNKLLRGEGSQVDVKGSIPVALQALAKVSIQVAPKIEAAMKKHMASSADQAADLKAAADKITDKTMSGSAGERLDYLDLLADWREMDLRTSDALKGIKEAAHGRTINGLSDYETAMNTLAVRGETLVLAMREAYDARSSYLLMEGAHKACKASLDGIDNLCAGIRAKAVNQAVAWLLIRQQLVANLAQRRRAVFTRLREMLLALVYQSNDVSLPRKPDFAILSPALPAPQLSELYATLKEKTFMQRQRQGQTLRVSAAKAFPIGWQKLLVGDREVPFQVPLTLPKLSDEHHMRILDISAEFDSLTREDGTTTGKDNIEYTLWLGPRMLDRASPDEGTVSHGTQVTVVQYYMAEVQLQKQGANNKLLDEEHEFAKRAVCCMGKLSFKKAVVDAGWKLSSIKDIFLNISYETLNVAE